MGSRIEDTPVYRDAMAFAVAVDAFAEKLPSWRGYLKGLLRRASLSILLNLREGGAEISPREKARFYRYSKRSGAESATALDFAGRVEPHLRAEADRPIRQADPFITRLYRLSRSQLTRAGRPGGAPDTPGGQRPRA